MSKFDMIIGYTGIKRELQQIADTLKNCEAYEKLNVSPSRGLLLHGEPGVGKSLMASHRCTSDIIFIVVDQRRRLKEISGPHKHNIHRK